MHQCLTQWVGDNIEVVTVDSSFNRTSAEAHTYERVGCFSSQAWKIDFLKVADYELQSIKVIDSEEELY